MQTSIGISLVSLGNQLFGAKLDNFFLAESFFLVENAVIHLQ